MALTSVQISHSKCKPVWNPIAIIHEFEFTRSCKYIWHCCAYWTHVRQNGNIWETLKSRISSLYNIFRERAIINFQHFPLYTALSRLVPLFKSSLLSSSVSLFEKENEKTLAFCQIVVEQNQYCQQHQQFPLFLLSEPTWLYEIRWSPHAILYFLFGLFYTLRTLIPSYTIRDFLRFFHCILLFCPVLWLNLEVLSTLYHYSPPYYYLALWSDDQTIRTKQGKLLTNINLHFNINICFLFLLN